MKKFEFKVSTCISVPRPYAKEMIHSRQMILYAVISVQIYVVVVTTLRYTYALDNESTTFANVTVANPETTPSFG